jgi:tetratricopeptide (TPR) repeat protein
LPEKYAYAYREQEVSARYPYFHGKFLIDNGAKKDGIAELKNSLKIGRGLIWLHNNVGDVLRQNNNYLDAEYALKKAIQLDSLYSQAYYNLGLLYLEKQQEEKAAEYFQQAYRCDKTDADSLRQLSKISQKKGYKYFVEGRIEDAVAEYIKAIRFTPSEADIYYNVGVIYSQSQNKKEAKKYFQKYLELKQGGPNAETVKKWLATN